MFLTHTLDLEREMAAEQANAANLGGAVVAGTLASPIERGRVHPPPLMTPQVSEGSRNSISL